MIGWLALCSLNSLGIILKDEMQEVTYSDGNKGMAYIGLHLTDKVSKIGAPWSSRHPRIIGTIQFDNVETLLEHFRNAA